MEKNMKKNVYIGITESLCCTAETNKHTIVNHLYFNKKGKTRVSASCEKSSPTGNKAFTTGLKFCAFQKGFLKP